MAVDLVHMIKTGVGRLRRPAFDARAAVELTRFDLPFFPATRYALTPSALLTVLNDIAINQRRVVMELGSGYSSLYISKLFDLLDLPDARVITVDAHAGWLDIIKDAAARAGVDGRMTFVHAPLAPAAGGDDAPPWYDRDAVAAALGGDKADLLLVDGPVASGRDVRFARAPALPMLKDALAERCAIFLDDIHRPSHAQIARDWGQLIGVPFREHHSRGGFAYAARGEAFDPIL